MLRLTVNGRPVECAPGTSLLQVIRDAGLDIPTLCHDPRLQPTGACRLCVVHVKGHTVPRTACNTLAEEGMVVETASEQIEHLRRTILQLLARQYPPEAVQESPDLPLHRYFKTYGVQEFLGSGHPQQIDRSNPYIRVDMSRCVHCFRCVRICDEVQGQFVWRAWNRGDQTVVRPDGGASLLESPCVSCGACADTCPSGAIADRTPTPGTDHLAWTRTVCPYCGVGCEMEVASSGGRIVSARPAQDAPVNKGHLCAKGRYAFGFNNAPDRGTEPMLRVDGKWKPTSWERAIEHVAHALQRIVARDGPDAIGILGSSRATNEENYLVQKFARVVLRTNNVDCCARVCHAPSAAGMTHILGAGAATNSFDDIERASAILVCGANPTENHPVVGARIKQRALRGVPLIVIDPRRTELARYATVHLPLRPGTNVPVLNALACVVIEEGLTDETFVRERLSGYETYRQSVLSWTPEKAASACSVDPGLIRAAARLYATHKPAICFHGLGITEHRQGTDSVKCLVNLALLTGNIGKPGSGVNPLRGQNNVQGAAHMGCDPEHLAGYQAIETAGSTFETAWSAKLPRSPGLNLLQMIDAAGHGQLKALWAIGYDIGMSNPNATQTQQALAGLELLVVQDLFLNQTARYSSVFLPVASGFEKEGTCMNSERRVQRVRQVVPPPGNCWPDWKIICEVAKAMGHSSQFAFTSPQEIWDEIRSLWPAGRGMTYDRLQSGGLQWPCPDENHLGTPILHVDAFTSGARAELCPIGYKPTPQRVSQEFPFLLVTGRHLYAFNSGTMSRRTPNASLRETDHVDVSPTDADRLNLHEEDVVVVTSQYGRVVLPVRVSQFIKAGELFTTFHDAETGVNRLIGNVRDQTVGTPEYKVTAVRLERI
jgi:formate dehydrogenase major subunit